MIISYSGKRSAIFPLDNKYKSVCEPGTLDVISVTSDKPVAVGVSINNNADLSIKTSFFPWRRPTRLVVKISGIRRGFNNVRFEEKNQKEFDANERRLTLDL